jgi:hypothetical protein
VLLLASATATAAPEVDPALPAYHASGGELAGELRFAGGDTMLINVAGGQEGQQAVALNPMPFLPLTATQAAVSVGMRTA